jgi:hypothetical protein
VFDDGRTLRIGSTLEPEQEEVLMHFLKANLDVLHGSRPICRAFRRSRRT